MELLTRLEFSMLYAIQDMHTPWLDWFMVQITSLGDKGWFIITLGVVLFCIKKTRNIGIAILVSVLIGLLIGNGTMKILFERQRPSWLDPSVALLIPNPTDFSFPSGHSMVAFEGAVSIYLQNKRWGMLAIFVAVLIAFSRMYLFVHFPTDVLIGSLLGAAIAWFVYVCQIKYGGKRKRSGSMNV